MYLPMMNNKNKNKKDRVTENFEDGKTEMIHLYSMNELFYFFRKSQRSKFRSTFVFILSHSWKKYSWLISCFLIASTTTIVSSQVFFPLSFIIFDLRCYLTACLSVHARKHESGITCETKVAYKTNVILYPPFILVIVSYRAMSTER